MFMAPLYRAFVVDTCSQVGNRAGEMKAILFDLDGVFYVGEQPLPGARETLEWVRAQGIPHLFLTNTSSRPRSAIVAKLAAMGISVEIDELLTPASAVADWAVRENAGPLALFVAPATREEFVGLPRVADEADNGAAAVVVGDLGAGWDFATLNRAFRLLMDGAPQLVALGMTRYWRAEDGLRLDAGPMVAALSYASGCEPLVLGKPAPAFFHAALARLGVQATDTLMIGDDIVGDVQGAQKAGLRGVLVRTGKYRDADLERGVAPDLILDSVADLPAWWQAQSG
jgi:phospholysine phosphohistidine inorganic pyrophosphate phosphatase